jgi:uncharacterized protein YqgV (UPF0045/DUF77 family)
VEIITEKRTMNVGVQVLVLLKNAYLMFDRAIEAMRASALKYELGLLETTLEGDNSDQLLEVAKSAHQVCYEVGWVKW